MGKSPGRWIKHVIFRKKTSKSNFPSGKEKSANEKEVHVRESTPETGVDVNPPYVSSGDVNALHVDDENEMEYQVTSVDQRDGELPASDDQNADVQQTKELDMLTDAERIAQVKAATKAQAAFRGYLARRAFTALKGIIRLQALIRGHLVRRQAVSTLYCMLGIVKLQALVRGSRIRCSDIGLEVQKVCIVKHLEGKIRVHEDGLPGSTTSLSANAFIRKLLAPTPAVMPLRVQYDVADPNSDQNWLQRWSISCPWKPVCPPKKVTNSRVPKKQGGHSQAAEVETGRPKRSVRKVPPLFDNVSAHSTPEMDKPRRNLKKVSTHPAGSVQENPQNELEKVKRSLRKVHNPVTESAAQPEEVSAPNEVSPVEEVKEDTKIMVNEEITTVTKPAEEETSKEPIEINESVEFSNGDRANAELDSLESDEKEENIPMPNGELEPKEDSMSNENKKSSRRASFVTKQEHVEDGLQNTPKLPSYMQATESAKAKLRAQGSSPRFGQDGSDKNNLTRRHSLPSSTNGKASSVSPKTPKPLQGSGKGGNRSDKSLSSSRDGSGGKNGQAQWRR